MNPIKSEDELREQILDLAYIPSDATRESPLQLLSVDDIVNLIATLQRQHERELVETRIDELKQLEPPAQTEDYEKLFGDDGCTICGFSGTKFRKYINERIAQLTNNQEGEK